MKEKIPQEIKNLYQEFGWKVKLYAVLRWRLCPFEEIEKYLPRQGVALDIGCGYGLLANFLALKSDQRQVIGLDNSLKRLAVAKSTVKNRPNIKFIQKDVSALDLPACQAVVMSDVLHHLPERNTKS